MATPVQIDTKNELARRIPRLVLTTKDSTLYDEISKLYIRHLIRTIWSELSQTLPGRTIHIDDSHPNAQTSIKDHTWFLNDEGTGPYPAPAYALVISTFANYSLSMDVQELIGIPKNVFDLERALCQAFREIFGAIKPLGIFHHQALIKILDYLLATRFLKEASLEKKNAVLNACAKSGHLMSFYQMKRTLDFFTRVEKNSASILYVERWAMASDQEISIPISAVQQRIGSSVQSSINVTDALCAPHSPKQTRMTQFIHFRVNRDRKIAVLGVADANIDSMKRTLDNRLNGSVGNADYDILIRELIIAISTQFFGSTMFGKKIAATNTWIEVLQLTENKALVKVAKDFLQAALERFNSMTHSTTQLQDFLTIALWSTSPAKSTDQNIEHQLELVLSLLNTV